MIYDTNLYYKFTNLYNIKLFKSANPDQKWKCLAVALLLIVKLIRKPSTKDAYNAFKIVLKTHCVKSVQIRCFFGRVFLYSGRIQKNTDQKKLRFWTLFTQGHFEGKHLKRVILTVRWPVLQKQSSHQCYQLQKHPVT